MKKTVKRFLLLALTLVLLAGSVILPASAAQQDQPYAYVYDSFQTATETTTPYECAYRVDVGDFGIGSLRAATSLYVRGDMLYVCDTGNNRILQLQMTENEMTLVRQIDGAADGSHSLKGPTDLFVTEDNRIIIADNGNNRILILDENLEFIRQITRPDDPTVDQSMPFKPNKLVVTAEHIYVQATSVNKGLMEFSLNGEFAGYIGASPVKFAWADYIWKTISTDAQREAMVAFVPTEYNNISLDPEGFLFVTNSVFSKQELQAGQAEPLRRLNLKGSNILIQNGANRVIGDLTWDKEGPSKFVDVTIMDDGTYYCLDNVRSRIFAYDNQGNMLYAFGGIGTKAGYFTAPVSIERNGRQLLVLDSANGLITVMRHTGFGQLISNAIGAYGRGDYEASVGYWQEVLRFNGSYEMAYRGIGKVMLRNGDYDDALEYLKYAKDSYYYSKAWKLYRKDWIEDNIFILVAVLGVIVAAWLIVKIVTTIKRKVENYEMWHPSVDE